MAEKIVSPGVFTRENDLSFLSQGIGEIGAAIIGPFHKGPAFVPTVVNTQSEFEEIFGTPDGSYYTGYTVQNYLREAGVATIVRVGHIGGYSHETPLGIRVHGSGSKDNKIVGVFHATTTGNLTYDYHEGATIDVQDDATSFELSIPSASIAGVSASIDPTDGNDLSDVFGESVNGAKKVFSQKYFENSAADYVAHIAATAAQPGTGATIQLVQLPAQDFTQDVKHATTPYIKSQLISGERYDLFRLHTLGDGNYTNQEVKAGISNIKAAGSSNASDYATFTLTIRGFSDTDKSKIVLETYNNLTMDPASPNYMPKRIGDINVSIDAVGKMNMAGDYANRSKYVRVEVVAEGSFPVVAAPFGHGAYTNPLYTTVAADVPAVIFSTGSISDGKKFSGIDLETAAIKIDNKAYLSPIPASAGTGGNTVFSFDGSINVLAGTSTTQAFPDDKHGTINLGLTVGSTSAQFIVGFQGGFDGISPTIKSLKAGESGWGAGNSQGFNLASSTASGSVGYVKAINAVSNPDDFDINLVSVPGIVRQSHSYVFDKVTDMVESREDAFFIGDVVDHEATIVDAVSQGNNVDSNYVGTYYPWVKTIDPRTNKLTSVPPSVLMPGIYAENDAVAAEWFAPAGLNRGGITGAVSVLNRLTHAERDTLYEGKINPIASFPGEGIVAFGQKTLQDRSSALDRINVRRLLIKVKKYIASTSRYLVFEQNTAQTRGKFLNTVNPYLEGIQQRQGLYAFRVVMDESNNTPDVIDRNILAGAIYLQPTKTAEYIVIDFNILPTGASFAS
tara:strand:- start:608 stop:2977 length:2370 start_codon:yes stop_codon:yes gene_type:complete